MNSHSDEIRRYTSSQLPVETFCEEDSDELEFLRQYAGDLEETNRILRNWAAFWFFVAFILFAICGGLVMWAIL